MLVLAKQFFNAAIAIDKFPLLALKLAFFSNSF